jgi:nucleotide-binding universal stress UspA family protein
VRVIIGFDGSADAEAAIIAASNRAWPEKTEIFLVSALNPKRSALHSFLTPPLVKWVSEKTDNERTILGRMQEAHARVLRRKGCIVTCLIKEGDPKEILIREANAWKADSVFVGARGMSQMKRFLVGGVSSAVAAGAPCSVEVVRTTR